MTGDDFGLSTPVNDAIVKAHEKGILTTTSLMVSGPVAADALARAKDLPDLNVGLHLVLCNGKATLAAAQIPALVDRRGEFSTDQVASGIKWFFNADAKVQLEQEIRAQFEAFEQSGLRLDHVNAHKHMHLHPTVFDLIVKVGKEFGLTAMRIPNEPPLKSIINSSKEHFLRYRRWIFLSPFVARMKKKCTQNHLRFNDVIYGLHDSGHMHLDTLVRIIPHLADGVTEIYMHPATDRWEGVDAAASDYEFQAEFKALTNARIIRAVEKFDIELCGFNS